MTNNDFLLGFVPIHPNRINLKTLMSKTGFEREECLKIINRLGLDVYETQKGVSVTRNSSKRYPDILIYKDQHPYKAVRSVRQASKETKVPEDTIRSMIREPLKNSVDRANGGRTSPAGWGFDEVFENRGRNDVELIKES